MLLSVTCFQEVGDSIPGPVKSNTVSPKARYRCNVFRICVPLALSRGNEPSTHCTLRRKNTSIKAIDLMSFFLFTHFVLTV